VAAAGPAQAQSSTPAAQVPPNHGSLAKDDAINASRAFIIKQQAASDYRDSIRKSVLVYEKGLGTHCKSVDLEFDSISVRIKILVPLEIDANGVPTSGRWRETVPGTACNEKRMYNVQVDATNKGLRYTPTYPGTAQGDPELQHDTLKNIERARVAMPGAKQSCPVEVLNTQLVGPAATLLKSGLLSEWKEEWDVRLCGKTFTVGVKYTPDATGTYISVLASEIHAH
jgi:hypothetical protein